MPTPTAVIRAVEPEVTQVTIKEPTVAHTAPKQAITGDCSIVNNYDWDKTIMYGVCMAESRGNPLAVNPSNYDGSNDKGLFQLNSIHVKSGLIGDMERLDPVKNANAAYAIYKGSGYRAWSAYNNGSYAQFI